MRTIENFQKRRVLDELERVSINGSVFEEMGKVNGILILERRDIQEDKQMEYTCSQYVFGTLMQEPWAFDERVPSDLEGAKEFLAGKKYTMVEEPQQDDIVVYTKELEEIGDPFEFHALTYGGKKPPYVRHIGIYVRNNEVISKIGPGHVYWHDEDMVPLDFGSKVYYFRKTKTLHHEFLFKS